MSSISYMLFHKTKFMCNWMTKMKFSKKYAFILVLKRKLSVEELMLLNCGVGEDSWESFGLQGDQTSPSLRRSVLSVHWKDWCGSWNSNTLASWCEELTPWNRPWCWERLNVGEEGDDTGWDGWMASLTWWTKFEQAVGVGDGQGSLTCCMQSMGSERVGPDWLTELNWFLFLCCIFSF